VKGERGLPSSLSAESIRADAERVATIALAEDGPLDVTTLVAADPDERTRARIEYRTGGILAGTAWAAAVARLSGCSVQWAASEGATIPPDTVIGELQGSFLAVLRAERPLLNLLQRACGIATETARYVTAVSGTPCRILHTRKTAPGLRLFDVCAVLAGGGALHRLDLAHTVMVKDNHWQALERSGRSLAEALNAARSREISDCQVEVESQEQVDRATGAGASRLLIDNQTPETVRQWAARARAARPGIEIEATGGIDLSNARSYAEAGADYISIGALTHSVRAADVGLEIGGSRER
jgi:nicotinate-nucleotide pyrophosphorylase (carboxylating)